MTVTIDPSIKKQRIFIDKHGQRITEDQLLGGNTQHDLGADQRTNSGGEEEKRATT